MNSLTSVMPRIQDFRVIEGVLDADDRALFRNTLRDAVPGTSRSNLLVLARVMLCVLEERPLTRFRPVVSLDRDRPSLWQAAVLEATTEEAGAFSETSDDMVLEAANLARWVLGLPQQVCIFPLVFVSDEDASPDSSEEGL